MEGGALLTEEFNKFSKNYVMFLHITTRIEGRKYDDLLTQKGGRGWPSVLAMDADGNVVGQHSGPRTVDGFARTMRQAAEFVDLKAKAVAGDRKARIDCTLALARMGQLTRPKLEAAIGKLGVLSAEDKRAYQSVLADLMMDEIQRTAVGERFLEMERKGLVPTDPSKRATFFYAIWNNADFKGDIELMERSLRELKATWGGEPRYVTFLQGLERRLATAKASPQ
ncbi:MAG: hypothetical protein ACYSX0_07630 [Planctomycetota bacterium]|jgi:hypothetical protein